ncbi:MAG: phosphate acetyltransferase [Corynebacterium sp.]|nr:phosphate acetyltransferase [Corynebacterium sp.]
MAAEHCGSFVLGSIGRTCNGVDVAKLAEKLGLKYRHLVEGEATVRAVVNSDPFAGGEVLLRGTGSVDFDFRAAAALGVPVVILVGESGLRLHLARERARELGAVIAGEVTADDLANPEGVEAVARMVAAHSSVERVMSPATFEFWLLQRAKENKRRIVLPEGNDDRILRAADILLHEKICDLTILGDVEAIQARAEELNLDLAGATLLDPATDPARGEYAQKFYELRKAKGMTEEKAAEMMNDVSYYATMLTYTGAVDGMVSGACHTTAETIRPALQIIKTAPESSVVSSVFLMVLQGKLWAFGDCAVNPNPSPEQLAEIAVTSAETAAKFGISPRVAMLSYSTGASGSGPDVEACVAATARVHELAPDLVADGPLQFDAAVDAGVAASKMPESPVAGKANVFIFPDLNSGNICYKTAQRTGGALAVGPILQGLNKPVNDLSRGATVADIVNTVAITAIQAGS